MNNPIGIIQGRLSKPLHGQIQHFPQHTWSEEFQKAGACGLDGIEWVLSLEDLDRNPLLTPEGPAEIIEQINATGVRVLGICCDCFRDAPVVRAPDAERSLRAALLTRIVQAAATIGAQYAMVPFVEHASLVSKSECEEVTLTLRDPVKMAGAVNVSLTFETTLTGSDWRGFLDGFESESVGVTYDVGDRASLGFAIGEDFDAVGSWIRNVHIKDRIRNGGTVPLGTGNADLPALFHRLSRMGFAGPLVIQAAREAGDEMELAQRNVEVVRRLWDGARLA